MILKDKRILITGGTGSLGKVLTNRLLKGIHGKPKKIVIFSRDEAKQHDMRLLYKNRKSATDEIIYHNFEELIEFRIGDVRDFHSIACALRDIDIVFNAAALKQVPTCEYAPFEAVMTNIQGPQNIVNAIREYRLPVECVVGVSTDKACKPVNVMGMTKAIQERIFIQANLGYLSTRFVCVRYGNVLASRGSVIPLFNEQINAGGPVTVTTPDMTRFLISLEDAVDVVITAVKEALPGETYIPKIPSAKVIDVAKVMIGNRKIKIEITGIRPGEKIHEILISEEECHRVINRGKYYVIKSILPELIKKVEKTVLHKEYSSSDDVISQDKLHQLLKQKGLLNINMSNSEELLR